MTTIDVIAAGLYGFAIICQVATICFQLYANRIWTESAGRTAP